MYGHKKQRRRLLSLCFKTQKTKRYYICISNNRIKTTPYIEYAYIQDIFEAKAKMTLEIKKFKNYEIKK